MSIRRSRLMSGLVLAFVALAGGWWLVSAATEEPGNWVAADNDDLVLGVEVTGTLQSIDTSHIGPPQIQRMWNFKISFMAPEGQQVQAGTPILGFDVSELQDRLDRQKAEAQEAAKQIEKTETHLEAQRRADALKLAEAEAALRKARMKVDTPQELTKGLDLELARLDLQLAEAEVAHLRALQEGRRESAEARLATLRNQKERAENQVAEIERDIRDMTRTAPRTGTVIYATNWRDEKKKVGEACWRREKVMELPDLSQMKAEAKVDEADAGKLSEGQRVTLRLDAHPDDEFTGRVASIWRTVEPKSWRSPEKVIRLEVSLDATDTRKMRPGMRFRGLIETERLAAALLVPAEAVFVTDEGPVVYRQTWLGHERVPVELGGRNSDKVEVVGGLAPGDRISLVDLGAKG